MEKNKFSYPLMDNNIDKQDIKSLIDFLDQDKIPRLTNGDKVKEFEKKWGEWLGTKYNVMVNSGAAANELTMLAIKHIHGGGEVIVPPLTWISDISAVINSGLKLKFCDINLKNLSFDLEELKARINEDTRAIFLTHVLGINALSEELLEICRVNNILLIEDVCESHGVTFKDRKVGTYGYASNFSFYFAHHMSTIEGGMISTDDEHFYQICRALRSHGMMREMTNETLKKQIILENRDLNEDFIFIRPAHNHRSTELNAVIGLSQLKKLDKKNSERIYNFEYFMDMLDSDKYITDLEMDGQCNYAFIVIMKDKSQKKRDRIEAALRENNIEFRRGLSGGGNQLRQPYFKKYAIDHSTYPNIEHVHHYSWYIGNYPTLKQAQIERLLEVLNDIE